MKPLDYDAIAPAFDNRYRTNEFEGIRATLVSFLDPTSSPGVLEIGCGTSHWLSSIQSCVRVAVGLDPSRYAPAATVRHMFERGGFIGVSTEVAQHSIAWIGTHEEDRECTICYQELE